MGQDPGFRSDRPTESATPFGRVMIYVMAFIFGGLVPIIVFHLLLASFMGKWYIFIGGHVLMSGAINGVLFLAGGLMGLQLCYKTFKELKEDP